MSGGPPILAVTTAPHPDARVSEFLRLCVGLVAAGQTLRLVRAGSAGAWPGAEARTDEADEFPAALAALAEGPGDAAVTAGELRDALRQCERVLRVAAADRRGEPAVLVIDDAYLGRVSDARLLEDLEHAGQVIRVREPTELNRPR